MIRLYSKSKIAVINLVEMGDLIEKFTQVGNKRVLVIGDAAVDKYITGTATRISPDAPVPVLDVEDNALFLGAAGLVVKYVLSLGGMVDFCTVVGIRLRRGIHNTRTPKIEHRPARDL